MIFQTSIRRELTRSFSAALFVLVVIMITMMLIRTLKLANRGLVNPSEVSLVLGYMVLAYLPTLLTLSLFVSVAFSLSRMYRDSEMAVWFSSGQGLLRFLKPLLHFAFPIIALVALLSLFGWPWANSQVQELRARYQSRSDVERIAPGIFQESADGNRVFYVDNQKDDADLTAGAKLFVFARQPDSEVVVSASNGRLENKESGRWVVLLNGQSTEIKNDQTLVTAFFKEYGIRVGNPAPTPAKGDTVASLTQAEPRTVPTRLLLRDAVPHLQAEFGSRLGLALASINLLLIALASAHTNPRAGRSGSLLFAMLSFAAYYNMINVGKGWVASGKLSLPVMLLLLHGSVFLAAALWLLKQDRQWSWRALLPAKHPASAAYTASKDR